MIEGTKPFLKDAESDDNKTGIFFCGTNNLKDFIHFYKLACVIKDFKRTVLTIIFYSLFARC